MPRSAEALEEPKRHCSPNSEQEEEANRHWWRLLHGLRARTSRWLNELGVRERSLRPRAQEVDKSKEHTRLGLRHTKSKHTSGGAPP